MAQKSKKTKPLRNLANINHWIAELRSVALAANLREEDGSKMTAKSIRQIFCKYQFKDGFNEGLTPREAFEVECWTE